MNNLEVIVKKDRDSFIEEFNNVVSSSDAEFLVVLCEGNRMDEGTRDKAVAALLNNKDCVMCNYNVINSEGQITSAYAKKAMFTKSIIKILYLTKITIVKIMIKRIIIHLLTFLVIMNIMIIYYLKLIKKVFWNYLKD